MKQRTCYCENYNCEKCFPSHPIPDSPKEPKLSKAGYWQSCPICNGSGVIYTILSTSLTEKCTVCNGKKIISTLNGLPPL